jgi:hypothetical protein
MVVSSALTRVTGTLYAPELRKSGLNASEFHVLRQLAARVTEDALLCPPAARTLIHFAYKISHLLASRKKPPAEERYQYGIGSALGVVTK